MWSGSTTLALLIKNHTPLLEVLSGTQRREFGDSFWQELLTFPAPLTKYSPTGLEAALLPFCERLGGFPPSGRTCMFSCASNRHTSIAVAMNVKPFYGLCSPKQQEHLQLPDAAGSLFAESPGLSLGAILG